MFCTNCGKQLDDNSKFCIYCGTAIAAKSPPAPTPVEAPPAAEPAEAPVPQIPLDPQIDLYPDPAPAPEYPAGGSGNIPFDANVYSDPKPPVTPKKKGGKKGLIIAIALVLVLLIGGGVGFYLYTQHVYEENMAAYEDAQLLLDKGDYDGALAGFLALGDFEDAASRAKKLQKLQEAYDDAVQMLVDKEFSDAREAFLDLGDYRDSENYVKYEITYLQAYDHMLSAQEAQDEYIAAELFRSAAEIFATLGDYSDAADLASECYLESGLCMLRAGDYDQALSVANQLNPADAEHLQNAYAEVCDDGAFLKDLKAAMLTWYDADEYYNYADELEAAWDMVLPYADAYFADTSLMDTLESFQYALQVMYGALDSDTSVGVWSEYYLGEYLVFSLAEELYDSHGLFADDPENLDIFVGNSELYYAYSMLEYSFECWWRDAAIAEWMDDGNCYTSYTNDTDYSFTLYTIIYFYDNDGNLLEVSDEMAIYVAKGATVYIPITPETISADQWQWNMYWDFGDVS